MKIPEHGGSLGRRFSFSLFDDPRVGGTVETDPWRVDPLKARDTYLLETRSVVVRQFFAGKKALQQTTPFRLEAGLGATARWPVAVR